jgi:hypothetical protein
VFFDDQEKYSWDRDALCAKKSNKHMIEWFFSEDKEEVYAAKNLCFSCPVRRDCAKYALETKKIWGVWGGKDENERRRTLSVDANGDEYRRNRFPQCGYCSARTSKLRTYIVDLPGGGRWTTARMVECTECGFSWRSRTSANAVNAYHAQRADKKNNKKS